jgi:hypothetical protein
MPTAFSRSRFVMGETKESGRRIAIEVAEEVNGKSRK